MSVNFIVEARRERADRWVARVREVPGTAAYGQTRAQAVAQARAIALRALAERLDRGEVVPQVEQLIP